MVHGYTLLSRNICFIRSKGCNLDSFFIIFFDYIVVDILLAFFWISGRMGTSKDKGMGREEKGGEEERN